MNEKPLRIRCNRYGTIYTVYRKFDDYWEVIKNDKTFHIKIESLKGFEQLKPIKLKRGKYG
jgi:hypothetical protein